MQTNFIQHWRRDSFRKNITIANETPWTLWGSDLVIPVQHQDAQTTQQAKITMSSIWSSMFTFFFFFPPLSQKKKANTAQ